LTGQYYIWWAGKTLASAKFDASLKYRPENTFAVIAYSDGQQIGQIADHNGTTNANFVRFGSHDQLFTNSLGPDPARFQLTNFILLHSIGLFQKSRA